MSTWTKAIIAASAVIIMVHWYCRTTNVYLHFCIYCYNASDIMEENIISWNRVMSMRCYIFKSHIFIIHIILEKLLPAFGIIYNSYKSYNDWKFNFVWVTQQCRSIFPAHTHLVHYFWWGSNMIGMWFLCSISSRKNVSYWYFAKIHRIISTSLSDLTQMLLDFFSCKYNNNMI